MCLTAVSEVLVFTAQLLHSELWSEAFGSKSVHFCLPKPHFFFFNSFISKAQGLGIFSTQ